MSKNSVEDYLQSVTKRIYDSRKRKSVRQELLDTIEDFTEMYIEMGMTEEEARAEAVKQMGSPEETGQMFNQIYYVKYEWKVAAFIAICSVVMRGAHYLLNSAEHTAILDNIWWIAFLNFYLLGFILSFVEKWMDLPMFYGWAENWNGGGLRNASMFIGIALGCMPVELGRYIAGSIIGIAIILLQRSFIETKRVQKEQKFLWKTAEVLEDFEYKGNVKIDNKILKVRVKKGMQAKKGEKLTVVGIDGFTLVVD